MPSAQAGSAATAWLTPVVCEPFVCVCVCVARPCGHKEVRALKVLLLGIVLIGTAKAAHPLIQSVHLAQEIKGIIQAYLGFFFSKPQLIDVSKC